MMEGFSALSSFFLWCLKFFIIKIWHREMTKASDNNLLDMPDKPSHQRQVGKIDKIINKCLKTSKGQQ